MNFGLVTYFYKDTAVMVLLLLWVLVLLLWVIFD